MTYSNLLHVDIKQLWLPPYPTGRDDVSDTVGDDVSSHVGDDVSNTVYETNTSQLVLVSPVTRLAA